ncbi:hypothetical protein O9X90_20885 [Agrobacterium leguminum]|uniref:hypothetical protein n=1 Tax=Agrobacterium tumefaciens TaxID=358 RepID=UPI001EF0B204|nr:MULTISPECIES: hypothetical protein [Rhizobiaceae]MCZ7934785.1 hypothetical protein [Agrobacterium leguminum]MCZ7977260.1 hypothetical protein [Agrobacterium salinitolerans]
MHIEIKRLFVTSLADFEQDDTISRASEPKSAAVAELRRRQTHPIEMSKQSQIGCKLRPMSAF